MLPDFLASRPFLTGPALRVIWLGAILREVILHVPLVRDAVAHGGTIDGSTVLGMASALLEPVVRLAVIRLMLETASALLAPAPPGPKATHHVRVFDAGFGLRPWFTRGRLSLLWVVLVIATLVNLFPLYQVVDWRRMDLSGFIGIVEWIAWPLVRLALLRVLIEVAVRVIPSIAAEER